MTRARGPGFLQRATPGETLIGASDGSRERIFEAAHQEVCMSNTLSCVFATTDAPAAAHYEIEDRFTPPIAPDAQIVDVWCPLAQDTPYQRVVEIAVDAPVPWTLHRDADHGNLIMHARLAARSPSGIPFRVRYRIHVRQSDQPGAPNPAAPSTRTSLRTA